MATTTKPETAFRQVKTHAEKIRNDAAHTLETCSTCDAWAQGDILIVAIEGVPKDSRPIESPSAQLAPGTTQGSRHCIADCRSVRLFRLVDGNALDGPIISAPEGCTITHPEHGDITLPPGVYGVIYQRAFADELRRVLD